MRSFILVALALVLDWGVTAAADKSYTMKDLQALAKESAWEELIQHAGDISPSGRTPEWKDLVEKAVIGRLNAFKDEDFKSMTPEGFQSLRDDLGNRYPHLKSSKKFDQAANLLGVRALKGCLESSYCKGSDPDWLRKVYVFVEAHQTDKAAACAAGKMVMTRMVAYTALYSFEFAVSEGAAAPCCKEADLKKAVDSGMAEGEYSDTAKKVAQKCGLTPKAPAKK